MVDQVLENTVPNKRSLALRIICGICWFFLFYSLVMVISGIVGILNAPANCLEDNLSEDVKHACANLIGLSTKGYALPVAALVLLLSYLGKLPGTASHKKIKKV